MYRFGEQIYRVTPKSTPVSSNAKYTTKEELSKTKYVCTTTELTQIFMYCFYLLVVIWLKHESGGGTLNVEVIGMLVGIFLENPKKYSDFDFKPIKNAQIAIFRAVLRAVWGKIFQKFSRRP